MREEHNPETQFRNNVGFSISSIHAHGEGRGQVPLKPLPFVILARGGRQLGFWGASTRLPTPPPPIDIFFFFPVNCCGSLLRHAGRSTAVVFTLFLNMTLETRQGSGSSGYEPFIFSLFYVVQSVFVSIVSSCCFIYCHEYVSYGLLFCFVSLLRSVIFSEVYAMSVYFCDSVVSFHILL
jgi:hypothetical protein